MGKKKQNTIKTSHNDMGGNNHLVENCGLKLRIESLEVRHLLSASGWDIALVDGAVADSDMFADITSADDIIEFNSEHDSPVDVIDKISELASDIDQQISSLTIISHGQEGAFNLGNELISADDLDSLESSFVQLKNLLAEDAAIYIAGCNAGAGDSGAELVNLLAAVTEADVYASDDITGAGGDWELEVNSVCLIDAVMPFDQAVANLYQYSLLNSTLLAGDYFEVGTVDETTATSISDTINGVNVDIDLTSANGQFINEYLHASIVNSTLANLFEMSSGTNIDTFTLTPSTLQAVLDFNVANSSQNVYLVALDVDLSSDILYFTDGVGAALPADSFIGTYQKNNETDATANYNYDPVTGEFTVVVGAESNDMVSVFDISGLSTVTVTYSGNPGANTDNIRFALVIVDDQGPTATDDSATVDEDGSVIIDLFGNDIDPDGNGLAISVVSAAGNGTVVDNGNGTVTYTPDTDYNGADSFTYTIVDNEGSSSTAAVAVTVNSISDVPIGGNDYVIYTVDTPLTTVDLLANDYDGDGDILTVTAFTNGAHGTVVDNGDGTFTYTPDAGYQDADSFTYTISDGNGGTDIVTVDLLGSLLENPAFEDPDSGKISTDWDLIPGWDSDGVPSDSGVEFKYPGEGYSGIIKDDDPSFYQTTNTEVVANEVYTLSFRVTDAYTDIDNNWSNDPGYAELTASIYYDLNGTRTVVATYTFTDLYNSSSEMETSQYILTFDSSDIPAAVGYDIGVEFDNVTPCVAAGHSWIAIDDVSLTAESNTVLKSEFFEVGTVDETSVTSISDTVNGVNVDYTLISANGHYLNEHDPIVITSPALKDIFSFETDTTVEYMKLTSSTLQAELNLTWDTTDKSLYLAVTDLDLAADIVTLLDSLGNPLDADRYIGTYDPASAYNATPRYVYDEASGQFNNSVNEWTTEYFSVFDVSGLEDISIFVGGNPGADTSFMGYALIIVDDQGPDAIDDTATTNANVAKVINVFANDIDSDGNGISVDSVSVPAHGSVVDNGDGTITYTPAVDYYGSDSFTYTIVDLDGSISTATVTLTVNALPVGTDDDIWVVENTAYTTGNLLLDDIDADNDVLSISSVTDGAHGTVVSNGDGTVTYTPAADYDGSDSFTYTVSDGNGGSDIVTVNVTVVDTYSMASDYTGYWNLDDAGGLVADDSVAVNDGDLVNGPVWTAGVVGGALDFDGVDDYVVTGREISDSFTISFWMNTTSTGTEVGVQWYDGSGLVDAEQTLWVGDFGVSLLGDNIAFGIGDPVNHVDTTIISTSAVNDGLWNYVTATRSAETGEITLYINGVQEAQTTANLESLIDTNFIRFGSIQTGTYFYDGLLDEIKIYDRDLSDQEVYNLYRSVENNDPTGTGESITVTEDVPLTTGNLLANDIDADGDTFTITAVSSGSHGSVVDNGDGTVTYTPVADYYGADSFTYTITDVYGGADIVTANVTVNGVADAPIGSVDHISVTEDVLTVSGNLLANDVDADNDVLSIIGVTDGSHGSVLNNGDGTVTYLPDDNYSGPDSFTYTVSDGNGLLDIVTVNVTVGSVNDLPIAENDDYSVTEDGQLVITDLLVNDTDMDGFLLEIVSISQPTFGSTVLDGSGNVTYTPSADFFGQDTFTYAIVDSDGGVDTATVNVIVVGVEDNPVIVDDILWYEGKPLSLDSIILNDYDPDGDEIRLVNISKPTYGYISYDGVGGAIYIGPAGYSGDDTIVYTIADANNNITVGYITVKSFVPVIAPNIVDDSAGSDIVQDVVIVDPIVPEVVDEGVPVPIPEDVPVVPDDSLVSPDVVVDNSSNTVVEQTVPTSGSSSLVAQIIANQAISLNVNDSSAVGDTGTNTDSNTVIADANSSDVSEESVAQTTPTQEESSAVGSVVSETTKSTAAVTDTSSNNDATEEVSSSDAGSDSEGSSEVEKAAKAQQKSDDSKKEMIAEQQHDQWQEHSVMSDMPGFKVAAVEVVRDSGKMINISDGEMVNNSDVDMMFTESGLYIGSLGDISISPEQDALTAIVLEKQSDSLRANEKNFSEHEITVQDIDITVIGGAVGSVATGVAIAQGGASLLGMTKSFAVITAIDPTPVINSLASSSNVVRGGGFSGVGDASIEKILNLK